METIRWEVSFPSPPEAVRHCKKCGGKTAFRSSERFRVNAQKKALDVWLIYHCTGCNTTWNLPILSRISPQAIGRARLAAFSANDPALALALALDARLLRENGAETMPPVFRVHGAAPPASRDTRLHIACRQPAGIRVAAVLRQALALSRAELESLSARGAIFMESGADLLRCRLADTAVVVIRAGALGENS